MGFAFAFFPAAGLWTFEDGAALYAADVIIGLEDGRVAEFDMVGEGARSCGSKAARA